MALFGKKKSIGEIASEIGEIVTQKQRGRISQDEFVKKLASPNADLFAGLNARRFSLEDVDHLMAYGEKLDEEARLLFFDAVQTGLRTGGKGNSLSDYALTTSSTRAFQAALMQSAGFQEQKKWEASLKVCQMAEWYLAYIGAQPAYYNELGYAYWNLKRLKEAYQAFVKGEETAKKALASPNLPQDARSMYMELQTEFHQNAEKLKSHA